MSEILHPAKTLARHLTEILENLVDNNWWAFELRGDEGTSSFKCDIHDWIKYTSDRNASCTG